MFFPGCFTLCLRGALFISESRHYLKTTTVYLGEFPKPDILRKSAEAAMERKEESPQFLSSSGSGSRFNLMGGGEGDGKEKSVQCTRL